MSDQTSSKERRQYFRIKNELFMCYELIDSNEPKSSAPSEVVPSKGTKVSPQLALLRELTNINKENKRMLETLNGGDKSIIKHISEMSSRLSELSKQIIQEIELDFSEVMKVDISGGGLCFESSQSLKIDQQMKLELILMPQYFEIVLLAKVVDSAFLEGRQSYRIAVEFIKINESDRDAIIGQVFKTQSKMLRANRKTET